MKCSGTDSCFVHDAFNLKRMQIERCDYCVEDIDIFEFDKNCFAETVNVLSLVKNLQGRADEAFARQFQASHYGNPEHAAWKEVSESLFTSVNQIMS